MFVEFIADSKIIFATVSGLISVGVFLNYLRSLLITKTAKPHAYTWLIWGMTQATAVAGIWYGGGGLGAIPLTLSTVSVFIIFFLPLKYGTRNIAKSDTFVLILAFLAVIIWWQLNQPVLAIIMVTVIDIAGYIPSWRKSITEPWSEPLWSWAISPIGHGLALLALAEYNFFTLTYPLSLMTANIVLVIICLVYRTKVPRPRALH